MWTWVRWLLLALLIYYIVVYPTEAGNLAQSLVTGAIALFTGVAQSVAAFFRAIVA
jgi:hypothetical protein